MSFPVPFVPDGGYGGSRGFGADRSNVAKKLGLPSLLHGACDMVASPGTPVLAVDDGTVLYEPRAFFGDEKLMTYEFAIRHTSGFIARYCEIDSVVLAHPGQTVKKGQVIAYIGDQPGTNRNAKHHGFDMLHFEMYSGKASGSFIVDTKNPANGPYYRRSDLIDPTPYLRKWQATAVWPAHQDLYPTDLDDDGRVFLIPPS
ncbi:MAG TPA: M23 family metallopeptidase [Gemmatales bacterium]|nr:M23 family metallopeptidase [Gemmatales bacterium]